MTDSNGSQKRVTVKRPHPNPQIHEFLISLREEAIKVNSSLLPNLEEAIISFAKYPLPLTSAADCAILKGFNKKLCNYIDSRLNGASKRNKLSKCGESEYTNNKLYDGEGTNMFPDSCSNVNSNYIDINMPSSSNQSKKNKSKNKTGKSKSDDKNVKVDTDSVPSTLKLKNNQKTTSKNVNYLDINMPTTTDQSKNNKHKTKNQSQSDDVDNNNIKMDMECVPTTSKSNNQQVKESAMCKSRKGIGKRTKKPNLANTGQSDHPLINLESINERGQSNTDHHRVSINEGQNTAESNTNNNSPNNNQGDGTNSDPIIININERAIGPQINNNSREINNTAPVTINNNSSAAIDSVISSRHVKCDSPIGLFDGFNDPSDLLGKWDALPTTSSKREPTQDCSIDLTTFRPLEDNAHRVYHQQNYIKNNNFPNEIPMINLSDDIEEYIEHEMKSIENNANEQIEKNAHDKYDDAASNCLECSHIAEVANAFEISFKEKMRKDTEEIRKCVLPRKLYLPDYRSQSYAIVVALYEQHKECPYRESLTKEELIQKAQKHTDQLFTRPDSGPVSKLVMKGMIEIEYSGGEDYYKLTTMGSAVALELVRDDAYNIDKEITSDWPTDRVPLPQNIVRAPAPVPLDEGENPEPVFIEMPPGTFEIILLIDKHEHFQPSHLHKCKFELRSLTVGDFLWIARSRKTGQELVLPFVIERKRMDDLASSIKDGRFHEQKFRLRKSGLENVIYLIESHGKNKHLGLPLPTLKQAMVNTSVQDNFVVMNTESLVHTFKLLGRLSEKLVHDFSPKHLRGCNRDTQGKELMTFEYFNKASCKNKPLTVKETFLKMLLQLKGLSVEKALAITNKYETPMALMKAYDKCTEKDGEVLLASLKHNKFSKNVGPAVSKTIYQLFKMRL